MPDGSIPQVEITHTHPEFGAALEEAKAAGVNVLCLPCEVEPDRISII